MKINHALIGCGRVAINHVDAFQRIPEARILYACDSSDEACEKFMHDYGIPQKTPNYLDVLKDPAVTSVSITTPHDLHAPMILAALAHGKHVLVEKPLAIKPADAEKIIEMMRATNTIVMPVAQHRFDPLIRAISELVHAGELGDIVMTRAHLECVRPKDYYKDSPWRGKWDREGGSVLINQAWHVVDLLLWLAGPVRKAVAHMGNLANQDVMETEDTFSASYIYDNNAHGTLTVTGARGAQWYSYIELIGTRGLIAFDIGFPNALHRFQLDNRRALQIWRKRFKEITETPPTDLAAGIGYYGVTHRDQARAFVDTILGKSTTEGCDVHQALAVVKTIDAFYEAARTC